MKLPNPSDYNDPIKFLRAMHGVILENCNLLDRLAEEAKVGGVFKCFAMHDEWNGLLKFFQKVAPQHEKIEEVYLFPAITRQLPHMGFQNADSPVRFLLEGHEVLTRRTISLVKAWLQFRRKERDDASLEDSRQRHAADDAEFVTMAHELASLFREHVQLEEDKIYIVADRLLGPVDRIRILEGIRTQYDNQAVTGPVYFEAPQFSDPRYSIAVRYRTPGEDRE